MNHLLALQDLDGATMEKLVADGAHLKAHRYDRTIEPLKNQHWAMIFTKSSTRTRVSFETGVHDLGGHAMFFSSRDLQLGRGEPIKDTARVLGRMVQGAIIRTFDQEDIVNFAEFSGIPTINALTDEEHPCQVLADLLTIRENYPDWKEKSICFLGDGDCNMGRSWLWAAKRLGLDFVLCSPKEFQPPADYLEKVACDNIRVVEEPKDAVEGCDVLYTDVWVSMGKEEESSGRIETLQPYQINSELMQATGKDDTILMHCLPAYRGLEVTEEVLEEHAEVIFRQAENRVHAQKAILAWSVAED